VTLIDVLVAAAIFAFVATAGFETVRGLGADATALAQRASAAAALNTALGQLRAESASSSAVWTPATTCGPALSMLQRTAAGRTFITYVMRGTTLVSERATGPIDPCDTALPTATVLTGVAGFTTTGVPASTLAAHVDPVSGNADGGVFQSAIPAVAVDAHVLDYDGSHILAGNGIVEVSVDADPFQATADLVAGNRPNSYTNVLTYACGFRCEANAVFPEIASLAVSGCTAEAPDLPDGPAFYAPSATGLSASGRIVTTAYAVHLRYGFTFTDGSSSQPLTVYRIGPTTTWPAAANLSDAYPVDYTSNSVKSAGAAALAALFGPPANLTANATICAGVNAETDFGN
jgi:type II secretory pathway pseudopilin PulG